MYVSLSWQDVVRNPKKFFVRPIAFKNTYLIKLTGVSSGRSPTVELGVAVAAGESIGTGAARRRLTLVSGSGVGVGVGVMSN